MFCPHCGKSVPDAAENCPECGQPLAAVRTAQPEAAPSVQPAAAGQAEQPELSPKSRLAVTLLSFFFGGMGIHRFYVGRTLSGAIMLGLFLLGFIGSFFVVGVLILLPVSIWAFVDFIMAVAGCFKDGNGKTIKNW